MNNLLTSAIKIIINIFKIIINIFKNLSKFICKNYLNISSSIDNFDDFESNNLSKYLASILKAAIFLLVFVLSLFIILRTLFFNTATLGAFGDFTGGFLNPLLSFLTLVAVLLTIVIQNRELAATREELTASRKAQEEQAEGLREQLRISQKREKGDLTFKMLERWVSPHMRDQRLSSWNFYEKHKREIEDGLIKTYQMSLRHPKVFRAFTDVCQFISDLRKLIDAGRLDDDLAYELFVDPVYPWFEFIENVRVSSGEQGDTKTPHGARASYKDVQEWYSDTAKFRCWFDNYKPSQT